MPQEKQSQQFQENDHASRLTFLAEHTLVCKLKQEAKTQGLALPEYLYRLVRSAKARAGRKR